MNEHPTPGPLPTSHHHDDEPRPCTATDHDQETL